MIFSGPQCFSNVINYGKTHIHEEFQLEYKRKIFRSAERHRERVIRRCAGVKRGRNEGMNSGKQAVIMCNMHSHAMAHRILSFVRMVDVEAQETRWMICCFDTNIQASTPQSIKLQDKINDVKNDYDHEFFFIFFYSFFNFIIIIMRAIREGERERDSVNRYAFNAFNAFNGCTHICREWLYIKIKCACICAIFVLYYLYLTKTTITKQKNERQQ